MEETKCKCEGECVCEKVITVQPIIKAKVCEVYDPAEDGQCDSCQ